MKKKVYTREQIKDSLMRDTNREMGICEKIRMAYDGVYEMPDGELKERITNDLIDALWMAKKIADRMTYLYETYKDSSGHRGINMVQYDKKHLHWLKNNRRKRVCV